jgi:hypothetical protein
MKVLISHLDQCGLDEATGLPSPSSPSDSFGYAASLALNSAVKDAIFNKSRGDIWGRRSGEVGSWKRTRVFAAFSGQIQEQELKSRDLHWAQLQYKL